MARILVVDDEPKMTSLVCGTLEDDGHNVSTTSSPKEALDLLEKHSFDIVITDLSMPEVSGMDILKKAIGKNGTDVIMMTAHGTIETAIEALKAGAADYLLKPFSLDEISLLVNRLAKKQKTALLAGHYEQTIRQQVSTEFIGSSETAKSIKKQIKQVAKSDATVLLTGRSGTGKEVVARMIHEESHRREHPFIAINCAAITETLLESELFGHEKGAFTGAVERKRGRFELAEKGTIFLDEIGEMSTSMQTKLLRVIEDRSVVRVGGLDQIAIDVRIITATNRNLKNEIKNGDFREDLFYRINVFPIDLPDLSRRENDVIELAEHILSLKNYQNLPLHKDVQNILLKYDWPGNIRELRNVLERALIISGGEPLSADDFSLEIETGPIPITDPSAAHISPSGLENVEKEMILNALKRANGNKTEAAKILQITRRRLYSRMKIHNIMES